MQSAEKHASESAVMTLAHISNFVSLRMPAQTAISCWWPFGTRHGGDAAGLQLRRPVCALNALLAQAELSGPPIVV